MRRGMTLSELAERADVSRRTITAIEAGTTSPTDPIIERLAQTLKFPRAFFGAPEIDPLPPQTVSFRALSTLTARRRDAVLAAGALAVELSQWIERKFTLPKVDVPDLREHDPEAAAQTLRAQWGLGEHPIGNMVHLLEAHGVRVYSLAEDCVQVDAFSFWRDGVPYVCANTLKSGERGRFDAAHELGHLVLHRHGAPTGRETEQAADRFASALLMPRAAITAEAPTLPTVSNVLQLKSRWKTSVAALTYRLHSLGLMNEWQYRDAMVQISVRGWRKEEPGGIQRETSQLLAKVFTMLRQDGVTRQDVARELCVSVEDLDALIFGLVLLPAPRNMAGATASAAQQVPATPWRPRLV
jgi:Zn-dependent peptidase ImmA (M78 family)/transcriptional regulator with XRE-family HTH domain